MPKKSKRRIPAEPTSTDTAQVEVRMVAIRQLRIDPSLQCRVRMDEQVIAEYAEKMKCGTKFPPVIVFQDGDDLLVVDGFHRCAAAGAADLAQLEVEIHHGGRREALMYAILANQAHGLRRTNADKRLAVQRLLEDPEWRDWGDSELARIAGVSDKTVAALKKRFGISESKPAKYRTKSGKIATRHRRKRRGTHPAAGPDAPTEGPGVGDIYFGPDGPEELIDEIYDCEPPDPSSPEAVVEYATKAVATAVELKERLAYVPEEVYAEFRKASDQLADLRAKLAYLMPGGKRRPYPGEDLRPRVPRVTRSAAARHPKIGS